MSRRNRTSQTAGLDRRALLKCGIAGSLGVSVLSRRVSANTETAIGGAAGFGSLQAPDQNDLRLPPGFRSRIVAVSGQPVGATAYIWHAAPDGGATFATDDGGWIYVSNAELSSGNGGVSAIRFDSAGTIVDAYSILSGTTWNCAGGPTPWDTWLSCEERSNGEVYECDPFTPGSQGVVRPAMGKFEHEAAAVDPVHETIYLTEDKGNGLLYRFTPNDYPDLSAGTLEAAEILDPANDGPIQPGQIRTLTWHVVPDPTRSGNTSTRYQVPAATPFDGGEGCWYANGLVHFTTKGDDRVWRLDTDSQQISIIYDRATSSTPELSGADNVFAAANGDVYVAEDQGDMQIVALTPAGEVKPIVQVVGVSGSEITGPALSPDGSRLYFSSQRNPGTTYEVTGPFINPAIPTNALPAAGLFGHAVLAGALAAGGIIGIKNRR